MAIPGFKSNEACVFPSVRFHRVRAVCFAPSVLEHISSFYCMSRMSTYVNLVKFGDQAPNYPSYHGWSSDPVLVGSKSVESVCGRPFSWIESKVFPWKQIRYSNWPKTKNSADSTTTKNNFNTKSALSTKSGIRQSCRSYPQVKPTVFWPWNSQTTPSNILQNPEETTLAMSNHPQASWHHHVWVPVTLGLCASPLLPFKYGTEGLP